MATADVDLRVGVRWSKEEDKKLRETLAIHTEQIEEGFVCFKTVQWIGKMFPNMWEEGEMRSCVKIDGVK